MLPNLIFLFNLLDVIPPDVQLYRKAGGFISSVCDTFETCHDCIELAYVSGVIPIFYPNPDLSYCLFADLIW